MLKPDERMKQLAEYKKIHKQLMGLEERAMSTVLTKDELTNLMSTRYMLLKRVNIIRNGLVADKQGGLMDE